MDRISFQDTHVYPGCVAVFFFKITPEQHTFAAVATFSDGVEVPVEITPLDTREVTVRVNSYTTAHGTAIPKKEWWLRYEDSLDAWKVIAKM